MTQSIFGHKAHLTFCNHLEGPIRLLRFMVWIEEATHTGEQGGVTLVLQLIGAPLSSMVSTTCSCPERAAQWRGVSPSRVLASMDAPISRRSVTKLLLPHFAAT